MNKKIELLLADVGRPYEMLNKDGTYQGCFYPVQFLYPEKPKYKLRSKNDDKNYFYGLSKIKKALYRNNPCRITGRGYYCNKISR